MPLNDADQKESVNDKAGEPNKPTSTDSLRKDEATSSEESATKMAEKRKITVEEAQKIITERLAKRTEEERAKAIEDEKKRRLDGKKMKETIEELQNQERIRLAQQIRQEKLEKELYKKRLMEQIARDREAMRATNQSSSTSSDQTTSNTNPSATSSQSAGAGSSSTECKIALRFPDGSNLIHKFKPSEQLAAVKSLVQTEKHVNCEMDFVAPPDKKFTCSHMKETLESLGLCPASRLEVCYKMSQPIFEAD